MKVFDASALLAFLQEEPGGGGVEVHLTEGGRCGAANWSEVAQQIARLGADWPSTRSLLLSYPLAVEPVTATDGEVAAALWTPSTPLSLGDRLCLALGRRLGAEVLTADRAWDGLPGVTLVR